VRIHLGIDDTDSLAGGCTTKIATDLVLQLVERGVRFLDHPNLVRLNPNVPWKTRGNGAVCLRIECQVRPEEILELATEEIDRSSRLGDLETDPGVVVVTGAVPKDIVRFSEEALVRIVTLDEAFSIIKKVGADAFGYGSAQGVIGALAAIGNTLDCDHTFELIAYRSRNFVGKPRLIDKSSIFRMSEKMKDVTFNNIDPETGRILITPRGPDPILCGVRGESAEAVRKAFQMLQIGELVSAWVIFRTNQGTDAHLARKSALVDLQDNCAVIAEGTVKEKPHTICGGHVIFPLQDETGSVDCAAYEPTGHFREIVKRLEPGDRLRVFGGVRPPSSTIPRTINLEKLQILKPIGHKKSQNPICSACGKRMKSAGRGQGYRCKRCRTLASSKIHNEIRRELEEKVYLPPPRAHRHLTKPQVRYGRESSGLRLAPTSGWHFP